MLPPTLWAEIIIAGFVYLIAGFFFVLNQANVYNFQFMDSLKEYTGLISIIMVFVSYLLGMLMHRLIQILVLRPLNALLKWLDINFNVIGDVRSDYYLVNFVLYQYGSPFLHREIDIQFGAFALFSSLIVSSPLLGIGLAQWLSHTQAKDWATPVLITSFIFSILCVIANIRNRKHFNGLRDEAYKELLKIHEKTLSKRAK